MTYSLIQQIVWKLAVKLGIALQAGRSLVLFPMGLFQCFIDIILPVALWPLCRFSLYQNSEPHQSQVQLSFKFGKLTFLEVSGPLQAYTGIAFSFFFNDKGKTPDSLHKRRSLYVYLQEGKYSYAKNFCTTLVGKVLSWGHILGRQKRTVTLQAVFTLSPHRYEIVKKNLQLQRLL